LLLNEAGAQLLRYDFNGWFQEHVHVLAWDFPDYQSRNEFTPTILGVPEPSGGSIATPEEQDRATVGRRLVVAYDKRKYSRHVLLTTLNRLSHPPAKAVEDPPEARSK
jgi:hypothetical protein